MAVTPFWIKILDRFGQYAATVNGAEVASAVKGIKTLSYIPEGGILDQVGTVSFDVPMGERANLPLGPGAQVQVWESGIADGPVAWAVVTTKSETLSKDGHTAQFTCPDLLNEMVRASATTGFATPEGGESTTATLARLLSLVPDPVFAGNPAYSFLAWGVVNTLTGLDGIPFSAFGKSVLEAADMLREQRFAHFKRGRGRALIFGRTDDPSADWQNSGLVLKKAAPSPQAGALAVESRQTDTLTRKVDGNIQNMLVPLGGGTGILQLSLRSLYGRTNFTGYDPLHPVLQRVQQAGATADGFDYYIQDNGSLYGTATNPPYGRWEGPPLLKSEIIPVTNGAADVATAAVTLYSAATAQIKVTALPQETVTIVTEGRGDLRGIAGKRVRVKDRNVRNGVVTLAIDADYIVTSVTRTWTAGVAQDAWVLTSNGQAQASGTAIINGLAASLDQLRIVPAEMMLPRDKVIVDNVDAGFPLSLTLWGNKGIKRYYDLTVRVTPSPYRASSNMIGHLHDLTTTGLSHDVGNAGATVAHDVGAVPHDVAALQSVQYRVGGNPLANGAVDYDPGTKIHIVPTPPGSAVAMMYDPTSQVFYYSGTSHGTQDVPLASSHLGIVQVNPTTGGTGGTVKATTGGTGGAVTPTATGARAKGAAGTGGLVPDRTHTSETLKQGRDGLTAGASPTGLALYVNNVLVAGPTNNAISVELVAAGFITDPSADYQIEVRAASIGRVTIDVSGRYGQSTIG